jgi:hypothetical protein
LLTPGGGSGIFTIKGAGCGADNINNGAIMNNFEMHPIFDSPNFLAAIFIGWLIGGPFALCAIINSIGN